MTPEEFKAIEDRCNSATPLVWQADKPMEDGYPCPMCDGEGDLQFSTAEAGGTCAAGIQIFGIGDDLIKMMAFHEQALDDTKALIAEVKRLNEQLDCANQAYDGLMKDARRQIRRVCEERD